MYVLRPRDARKNAGRRRGKFGLWTAERSRRHKKKGATEAAPPDRPPIGSVEIRLRRSPQRARVRCLLAQDEAGVLCRMSQRLPYSRPVSGRQHLFRSAWVFRGELGGTPSAALRYPWASQIMASRAAFR